MSLRFAAVCAALVAAAASVATAQTAIRIDDVEVGEQMEQVQQALDLFIDGLKPQARTAVARGAGTETDLSSALSSLRVSASRLTGAFRPPLRNATEEVVRLLAQAKALDARLAFGPETKGSEARWGLAVKSLAQLGQAYHIDWRATAAAWTPRRVSDLELRTAVSSLRATVDGLDEKLGDVLEKDKVLDRVEQRRAVQQLHALSDAVHDLRKAFDHYDDMSAVIPRAVSAAAALKPFVEHYAGGAAVQAEWQGANRALEAIAQAFGM